MSCCTDTDACSDLPNEPGPCDKFEPCNCDWPPVAGHEHCDECLHLEECHRVEDVLV